MPTQPGAPRTDTRTQADLQNISRPPARVQQLQIFHGNEFGRDCRLGGA
jgi:hypothetical protein